VHRKKIERAYRISKYIVYRETLVDYKEKFWSFLGSFIGIGLIAFIQSEYLSEHENLFLIGSFGASSVLVFGSIQSPLAQPRNLIGWSYCKCYHRCNYLSIITQHYLADCTFICLAFNHCYAIYKNYASTRWCYSINCSNRYRTNKITWLFVCCFSCF
jgi:CBS-domain-containing membrane protein